MTAASGLASRCDLLRSLHRPGAPLVLPNAWDAATARAVAAAGFPAVATTSAAAAAALGYDDHEGAPAGEMLAAAARICRSVEVPVTVDAEAGYGLTAAELAAGLSGMGRPGCNLEDTDHAARALRDPARQAAWLRAVRQAASGQGYRLVINARIDVFVPPRRLGAGRARPGRPGAGGRAPRAGHTSTRVPTARTRSGWWEAGALAAFVSACPGPVNVLRIPPAPPWRSSPGSGWPRSATPLAAPRRDGAVQPRPRIAGGRAGRAPARRGAAPPRPGRAARNRGLRFHLRTLTAGTPCCCLMPGGWPAGGTTSAGGAAPGKALVPGWPGRGAPPAGRAARPRPGSPGRAPER